MSKQPDFDPSELTVQAWAIDQVRPSANNNKVHDEKTTARLAKSMASMGQIQPVIVDNSGELIAGHGRTLAAKALGWEKIKVIQLPVDRATAIKMRLADNLMSNQIYDREMTAAELRELQLIDEDFDLIAESEGLFIEQRMADLVITNLDDDYGIDGDAFSEDVTADVGAFAEDNERRLAMSEDAANPLKRAFGFATLNPAQTRVVKDFMALVMSETDETDPAAALVDWVQQVMT